MAHGFETFAQNLGWGVDEKTLMLHESRWGSDFEHFALKVMAQFMESYRFKPGMTIFREGDPGHFMAFVVTGLVKVLKEGDDEYDHAIADIGAGAALGEMALVDGGNRSATAIVKRDADILVLTEGAFEELGSKYPRVWGLVLSKLAKQLSSRLRRTSGELVDLITATGVESERY